MRIMIFGAGGFIGTNLAHQLYPKYELTLVEERKEFFSGVSDLKNCSFVEASLNEETSYEDLFSDIDILFLLMRVHLKDENDIALNQRIHQKVIDACIHNGTRIVFISSGGAIYGDPKKLSVKETDAIMPLSAYAKEKASVEELLINSKADYRIIRLANPYGPHQRPNEKTGVVSTFLYKIIKGEELKIFGDLHSVRDYIYIDDAVKAFINIGLYGKEKIYNVGSGKAVSLKELLSLVTVYGNSKVNYEEKRSFDINGYCLDVSRYENEFGPLAQTDMKEGIDLTYRYLKEKY